MRIHLIWALVIISLNYIRLVLTQNSQTYENNFVSYSFIEQMDLLYNHIKCDKYTQLCFKFSKQAINIYDLQQFQLIQTIQIQERNINNLYLAVQDERLILIVQTKHENILIYELDNHKQRQAIIQQQSNQIRSNQQYNQQVYIRDQASKLNLSMNLRIPQYGRKKQNEKQQHQIYFASSEEINKNILFYAYVLSITEFKVFENKTIDIIEIENNNMENNKKTKNIYTYKQKINIQIQNKKSNIIKAIISTNQQLLTVVDNQYDIGFFSLINNNFNKIDIQIIDYHQIFEVNKLDSSFHLDHIIINQEQFFIVTLIYKSEKQNIIIREILNYCILQQKVIYFQRQLIQSNIQKLLITNFELNFQNQQNRLENDHSNNFKFASHIILRQQSTICAGSFIKQNKINLIISFVLLILIGCYIQKNLETYCQKKQLGKDNKQKFNNKNHRLQENNNDEHVLNNLSDQIKEDNKQNNSNKQLIVRQDNDRNEAINLHQDDAIKNLCFQQKQKNLKDNYFDKFCNSEFNSSNLNSIQLQVFVFEHRSCDGQKLYQDYSNNHQNQNNTLKGNKNLNKKNQQHISQQNSDDLYIETPNILNNLIKISSSQKEEQFILQESLQFQNNPQKENKTKEENLNNSSCNTQQNCKMSEGQDELIYKNIQSLDNYESHIYFNQNCNQMSLHNENHKFRDQRMGIIKKIQKQDQKSKELNFENLKVNQNQKINIMHNEMKFSPFKIQLNNREIEKQNEENSDLLQNKFKLEQKPLYPFLQKQKKYYKQPNLQVQYDYNQDNKYSTKDQQKQQQFDQNNSLFEKQFDNTCILKTEKPFYIIEHQEEEQEIVKEKILSKDLNLDLKIKKFIPKYRSRKEHISLFTHKKKYPNLEQNIITTNQVNSFSKNNFQQQSCEDYFQFPYTKSIKLHKSWPQYRQNLNCFTQQSYFDQNYNPMKNQSKIQSQNYQIISSDTKNQFKNNCLVQQRACYQEVKVNQTYNQFKIHKNNQIEKSDSFRKNNLSEQSSQIKNQINQINKQQTKSIISCDTSILSSLNQHTSNNTNHTSQQLNNSNSIQSNNNQYSYTNNTTSSPQMWPLTYQEQQNNFEEEILNQMDTSNSQTNNSLLNSDFQCQRFMDNFLEQMGQNEKQEDLNEYDPFFCFSETTEKLSFFSSLSNECVDSVRKIRHISQELQQQDNFDIKDFQFINESLFEESTELKKNSNKCFNIYNPLQQSLEFTSIFGEDNNKMSNLQKMTEQINNDFLLSCANLLNTANNNQSNIN